MKQTTAEKQRRRGIYLLPNLFTSAGLFAGFYSIIAAMKGEFNWASYAIFIAMLMDSLDGRVARLTNTQTDFGVQYDSLADIVSFGIAPAVGVYSWGLMNLGKFGWLVAFLYTATGALRLARFNTQAASADKQYFQGLPIPSGAGIVAAMVLLGTHYSVNGTGLSLLVAIITISVSLLMVSNLRYYSFKEFNFRDKVPFISIFIVVLIFVCIALNPPALLFFSFFAYGFSGPVLTLTTLRKKRKNRKKPKEATTEKDS